MELSFHHVFRVHINAKGGDILILQNAQKLSPAAANIQYRLCAVLKIWQIHGLTLRDQSARSTEIILELEIINCGVDISICFAWRVFCILDGRSI